MPQYSGLEFDSCQLIGFLDYKFDETCTPGSGPIMEKEIVVEAKICGYQLLLCSLHK